MAAINPVLLSFFAGFNNTRKKSVRRKNIRVFIVGGGAQSLRVGKQLESCSSAGFVKVGHYLWGDAAGSEDLPGLLATHQADEVWVALGREDLGKMDVIMNRLRDCAINVRLILDFDGIPLLNPSFEKVAGLPAFNVQVSPHRGYKRIVKDVEDRLLAALILLAIWPVMLVIAIAVKLSSPGPVFYRQERVTWNNKSFCMLKFRSMPVDAESATGAVWAKAGESRATRVGAFLRKTSLDELPQFINVLKGDMSIVGPRPERPVFVNKFKDQIPGYMKKHMVKAGITGWAQVNGWRGSTDLAKRIECDLFYIENWSVFLDLKIIFLTLFKGFVHRNAY